MSTKNATVRLPEDLVEWMTSDGRSINQAIIDSVNTLRRVRQVSMGELRGLFTADEWKFLADSFNGSAITEPFRCNVFALVAHVEDSDRYDHLGDKWGVDMESFIAKIKALHGANVDALYSRIEDFWAHSDTTDLDTWAGS